MANEESPGSLDRLRRPLKDLIGAVTAIQPYTCMRMHTDRRTSRSAAGQVALESTPFSRCGISSSLLAEFGSDNFRLSQVHVGSGYRLRKVLEKAERGEKLTIGVLGGSGECSHSPRGRLERRRLKPGFGLQSLSVTARIQTAARETSTGRCRLPNNGTNSSFAIFSKPSRQPSTSSAWAQKLPPTRLSSSGAGLHSCEFSGMCDIPSEAKLTRLAPASLAQRNGSRSGHGRDGRQ